MDYGDKVDATRARKERVNQAMGAKPTLNLGNYPRATGEAAAPTYVSPMEMLIDRLSQISSQLDSATAQLGLINDTLLGGEPEQDYPSLGDPAPGLLGRLEHAVAYLQFRVNAAHEQVQRAQRLA